MQCKIYCVNYYTFVGVSLNKSIRCSKEVTHMSCGCCGTKKKKVAKKKVTKKKKR